MKSKMEPGAMYKKHMENKMKHKLSTPKGPHGRAAVKALGRTKTTGNFAKIEKASGKGAAINAYQNALKAHKAGKSKKKHMKKGEKAKKHEKGMKCKMHKKMHCKKCA